MYLRKGYEIKNGHLYAGGCDTVGLAKEHGTPLYVMDEDYIRGVCRQYNSALKDYGHGMICYASKAFSCKEIYRVAGSEGLGADVVSGGEILTAAAAGFPMDKVYFHGNNKQDAEIVLAIRHGVHAIVCDSLSEIEFLQKICEREKARVNVLVRLNPGIEAHTHNFVKTATADSKFGCSISDGTAMSAVKMILDAQNLIFKGFHSHIGSQIFEIEPYDLLIKAFTALALKVKEKLNADTDEFNLGGGFGVKYTDADKPLSYSDSIKTLCQKVADAVTAAGLKKPFIVFEPGRSIVAEAGLTLYTVGAVKDIKGIKKYVTVDGGMFENPRFALYRAQYSALLCNKAAEPAADKVTVAGKCCESGDIIVADTMLQKAERGDILSVLATGAYNFSMAGNYNRNPVPKVVMVKDGRSRLIVRGQTYEDMSSRDI